jgi:hypothetical protein
MNRVFSIIFSFLFLLFSSINAQIENQDKNDIAANMALKLQQKVLLSDQQTSQVKSIVSDYVNNVSEESKNNADKKIESLLDTKQKAKYNIIKSDWWGELNKDVSRAESK